MYTHCYGHALNLAVGDVMKKSRLMGDTLNTTSEISKLLKYFPIVMPPLKSSSLSLPQTCLALEHCPTCWTVKGESMESVVTNCAVFQNLWEGHFRAYKNPNFPGGHAPRPP